jgi:D-alanine-D-alanine ligase
MSYKPKSVLRVIVLVHADLIPPDSLTGVDNKEKELWRTEYDVVSTLRKMGHEVWPVGVGGELGVIREAIEEHKPQVAFNLLEEFDGYPLFDQHVVSYLELKKQKYTGCNPRGLTLSRDKALTKKILAYHRIHVPRFAVFRVNRKIERPNRLRFPLFVKSLSDEGSAGIAQASIVRQDEKLKERVEFIHRQNQTPALAEEFIERSMSGSLATRNSRPSPPGNCSWRTCPKARRTLPPAKPNGMWSIKKRSAWSRGRPNLTRR